MKIKLRPISRRTERERRERRMGKNSEPASSPDQPLTPGVLLSLSNTFSLDNHRVPLSTGFPLCVPDSYKLLWPNTCQGIYTCKESWCWENSPPPWPLCLFSFHGICACWSPANRNVKKLRSGSMFTKWTSCLVRQKAAWGEASNCALEKVPEAMWETD